MVYAIVLCPSVRQSQASTVRKGLNAGSRKQRHTIAHTGTLSFLVPMISVKFQFSMRAPDKGGVS